MVDIFREVDDEVRRARAEALWRRYGGALVALAVLVVAAVAGWRFWDASRQRAIEASGARFEQALDAARTGNADTADATLAELARSGAGGYAILARIRAAGELARRDPADGAARFEELARDGALKAPLPDFMALRGAQARLAAGEPEKARPVLERLAAPPNPWRHAAREMLATLALSTGDADAAGRRLDEIVVDPETPPGTRARAELLLGLVRAGPLPPSAPTPASDAAPSPATELAPAPASPAAPLPPPFALPGTGLGSPLSMPTPDPVSPAQVPAVEPVPPPVAAPAAGAAPAEPPAREPPAPAQAPSPSISASPEAGTTPPPPPAPSPAPTPAPDAAPPPEARTATPEAAPVPPPPPPPSPPTPDASAAPAAAPEPPPATSPAPLEAAPPVAPSAPGGPSAEPPAPEPTPPAVEAPPAPRP